MIRDPGSGLRSLPGLFALLLLASGLVAAPLPDDEFAAWREAEEVLVESLLEHHSLARRDRDIAGFVAADRDAHPGSRYLVVYGGYHLMGRGHLGARLAEAGLPDPLVLVDEAREVYWEALGRLRDPEDLRVLALGERLLYVRNGTPLERLRAERDTYLELLGWSEEDLEAELAWFPSAPQARTFRLLHAALH